MGWGAPARLALCVVRSRARGAGAGRARRHRDRESPATAREGLPVQAARALARATQADPSFAQASIDLANTALTQRIQPRLEVALQAVRLAAASTAGRNAGVQLARGRVEREVGEADSSVAGFRSEERRVGKGWG